MSRADSQHVCKYCIYAGIAGKNQALYTAPSEMKERRVAEKSLASVSPVQSCPVRSAPCHRSAVTFEYNGNGHFTHLPLQLFAVSGLDEISRKSTRYTVTAPSCTCSVTSTRWRSPSRATNYNAVVLSAYIRLHILSSYSLYTRLVDDFKCV